jgi:anti-sigma B factor antagonist
MAPQEAPTGPRPGVMVGFPQPGIAVVTLIGEHDVAGKQRLSEALRTASVRPNDVLVDLSACTFIDSSVIGALFLARHQLADRGGRLELVIPPEAITVRRIADLTKLDSLVTIHQDHAHAVVSLRLVRV